MSGFLFDEIIFGPVKSRRLGVSLGINLLPTKQKFCSFNCIYCECGWNPETVKDKIVLPKRAELSVLLEKKLQDLQKNNLTPDAITFAGNGEPTIHPEFNLIVKDTIALRDKYFPNAKTTVLSNSSMIHKKEIFEALKLVDNNILKLDTGSQEQFERICQAHAHLQIHDIVDYLCQYKGDVIIQTLFLRGSYNGKTVDNTTEYELDLWLGHLKKIKPKMVMIYPIDRSTPAKNLEKASSKELQKIAERVHQIGLKTEIY
jgi:wyosine [tRNA(Phe)-imidazoG37] synthetase (radical SAM superfamily)